MSTASAVSAAQDETKAILANLRQGQILLNTTSADFKPMMFAWEGDKGGVEALKRASETSTAYPVHPTKTRQPNSKKTGGVAPFPMDNNLGATAWESENHANYHDVKGAATASNTATDVNNTCAGFKNLDHVKLPVQFAWSRMNANGKSDAANAADADTSAPDPAPVSESCPPSPTRDNIFPTAGGDEVPVSCWQRYVLHCYIYIYVSMPYHIMHVTDPTIFSITLLTLLILFINSIFN